MKDRVRLLLVDDHGMVREGLRAYLERHRQFTVVGEASSGAEALAKIRTTRPHIVLLDINLPDISGFDILASIRREWSHVRIVIVTVHKSPEYLLRAFRLGASGYILKDASPDELSRAINTVQAGQTFITSNLAGDLIASYYSPAKNSTRSNSLSNREREVLSLIAAGLSSKEIAQRLQVAVRTIQTHRERIMRKLNIHTIAGLTRYALKNLPHGEML